MSLSLVGRSGLGTPYRYFEFSEHLWDNEGLHVPVVGDFLALAEARLGDVAGDVAPAVRKMTVNVVMRSNTIPFHFRSF